MIIVLVPILFKNIVDYFNYHVRNDYNSRDRTFISPSLINSIKSVNNKVLNILEQAFYVTIAMQGISFRKFMQSCNNDTYDIKDREKFKLSDVGLAVIPRPVSYLMDMVKNDEQHVSSIGYRYIKAYAQAFDKRRW